MKKFDFKRNLLNLLIIFVTIFALFTINFAGISEVVFNSNEFSNNLGIILLVSFISSIIALLLTKINNISLAVQVIIIYSFVSIVFILLGFILYIYDYEYNTSLFIATTISLITGLIIVCLFIIIKSKLIDKSLNLNLQHFKERDQ